jgi:hypothetical protein
MQYNRIELKLKMLQRMKTGRNRDSYELTKKTITGSNLTLKFNKMDLA